ncbi:IS630 family transposase [Rhizobium sp. KAs_5_22]|uniref:IS630 family transposase n=1 Tax=Ciceribacter selenitireducens TaxID=448181 RepID=UPI000491C202|nr:IS630 family transposase [Ciceribacter selenitireducens]PPJ48487.1 IS630 family transposase [Rhizobium sp. KAs_5_22]
MARALSDDLRIRVLKASATGMSARPAAGRFGVGVSTAIRWIARAAKGEPTPRPRGWKRPSLLDAHEAFVVETIDDRRDVTLDEMVERLSAERQVSISRSALGAWLRGRGWAFKKSAHALEPDRPDVLKRQRAWFDEQLDLDPQKLIFIEEIGLSTKMARLRGRAIRGERCRAGVPHGHWKTMTFTGALRLTGMTAPFVYDGAMNGNVFLAYVEQVFLPPHCPDFNPIENAFSKLEAMLRARAERKIDALRDAVGALMPRFTPTECANYFRAAGYGPD